MPTYKISIEDRNYKTWQLYLDGTLEKVEPLKGFCPIKSKLFSGDVFNYDPDTGTVSLLHSVLRASTNIPGVLVLSGITYGRKGKKMLYKLIPDDRRLPIFLAGKEIKKLGHSKHRVNNYVVFKFSNWNDKHPHGSLLNTLGSVESLDNFYEYQLYCKSLYASIQQFSRDTSKVLKEKSEDEYIDQIMSTYNTTEDRTGYDVIAIDPPHSRDFDDAMSLQVKDDNTYVLSIYISNVSLWLDALGLWESFSERIATIYLPDRKRPMLPTCLADCLCSLIENLRRFAIVCDVTVCNNEIVDISYKNTLIKVRKNFRYEEKAMKNDSTYCAILQKVKILSRKYKFVRCVNDSHDLIAYLMILMNYYSAKEMIKHKNGVYRSAVLGNIPELPDDLPDEFVKFIKVWNSSGGQYVTYCDEITHDILDLDSYIHVSSPIRRLPDLLNIIKIQQNLNITSLTENASSFYDYWVGRLDYINTTMRAIRKVQVDCNLLHYVMTNSNVLDKVYDGNIFDMIRRNDGLFQYICYIPEIKLVSRLTVREEMTEFQGIKLKLYIFVDEDRLQKKIRLQML